MVRLITDSVLSMPRLIRLNKKIGTAIAINRATSDQYELPAVKEREKAVLDAFQNLEARAIKYFKDLPYEDVSLTGHLGMDFVNM